MSRTTTCPGPGHEPGRACGRTVAALGLCLAHYQWQRAHPGESLRPIRQRGEAMARISLRVPEHVKARVDEDASGARAALERWARS